jgi:hypothetical protein
MYAELPLVNLCGMLQTCYTHKDLLAVTRKMFEYILQKTEHLYVLFNPFTWDMTVYHIFLLHPFGFQRRRTHPGYSDSEFCVWSNYLFSRLAFEPHGSIPVAAYIQLADNLH